MKRHYDEAVEGILSQLLHRSRGSGWSFFGYRRKQRFISTMETLTCFAPGMLLYGASRSESPDKQRVVQSARSVLFTCHMMMNATKSGLPPESCVISDIEGMTIPFQSKHYGLRPEIAESFFYLKETLGDPIAQ